MPSPLPHSLQASPPTYRMKALVTKDIKAPTLGIAKAPFYIARAHLHVTEAFDDSADLVVGYDGDTDAVITSIALTSTGVKTVTLGDANGYNSTSRTIVAAVSDTPTQGKAVIILELWPVPSIP